MKTERLTAFGFPTDTFIPKVVERSPDARIRSEMLAVAIKAVSTAIVCVILTFCSLVAWTGHDLKRDLRGKITYLQCTKAIYLGFINPERGTEYLLDKLPPPTTPKGRGR